MMSASVGLTFRFDWLRWRGDGSAHWS